LEAFLYEAAQNFEVRVFSNIQDQNKKIKKPIAVAVLFKAYPMVPHTCIDPIWTDGTFKVLEEEMTSVPLMLFSAVK
jgi:hypothetical protein